MTGLVVVRRIWCIFSILMIIISLSSYAFSYKDNQEEKAEITAEPLMPTASTRRDGKWLLFHQFTSTVLLQKESIVTEFIPSSCVVVNPSLPPCRHVRQLLIQPTSTFRMEKTTAPEISANYNNNNNDDDGNNVVSATKLFPIVNPSHDLRSSQIDVTQKTSPADRPLDDVSMTKHKPLSLKDHVLNFFWPPTHDRDAVSSNNNNDNATGELSWAEYLGLDDVIVSKTAVVTITAKHYDPKTVITFSVVGCHPSRLPFNLPVCQNDGTNSSTTIATTAETISISKNVHYVP